MTAVRIAAFVSIPKNASNTLREMFELGGHRERDTTDSPIVHECHRVASQLTADHPGLFTFAFVRCPFARCFSWYQYHDRVSPYNKMSFGDWVLAGMPHHWLVINGTDWTARTPLLQSAFLDSHVDFVGRVEWITRDAAIVADRLNAIVGAAGLSAKYEFTAMRENAGREPFSIGRHYSTATRKTVEVLLAEDFERFDY